MSKGMLREVCKESLQAMRQSLLSSYEMGSVLLEEALFAEAWTERKPDFFVFSDYRRNEGLRRLRDVLEIIDYAILLLEAPEDQTPSEIYTKAMKSVSLVRQWARILEASA
ncbi:MAG: hypothetical protein KAR33_04215 [Candidatus Thorarchaeota archaeon]|nr:hypothetical protein [Candidatus Thorarchaeota archaeon]